MFYPVFTSDAAKKTFILGPLELDLKPTDIAHMPAPPRPAAQQHIPGRWRERSDFRPHPRQPESESAFPKVPGAEQGLVPVLGHQDDPGGKLAA